MKEPAYIPSKTDLHQRYRLEDGTVVPSTTQIIDLLGVKTKALMGWQKNLVKSGKDPDTMLTYYANIGTYAHALVEEHVHEQMGDKDFKAIYREEYGSEIQEKGEIGLESYKAWERENDVEYLFAEKQLVSEKYRYGGTIDIGAIVNGIVYNIDLKTSSNIYTSHIIQGSAYWNLVKENIGEKRRVMILKIGKNDVVYRPYNLSQTEIEKGFNTFWHLRKIHDNLEYL